jgi:MFS family permease
LVLALANAISFIDRLILSLLLQSITPDRMRAQFGAAYQLSLTLVGATLGPFSVALLTDYFFRDEARLGYSMAIVSAIANPIAAIVLWLALSRAISSARAPT